MTTEQRRPVGENQGGAGDPGRSGSEGISTLPGYLHVESALPLIVALLGRLVVAQERTAAAAELHACQMNERLDAIAAEISANTGAVMQSGYYQ